MRSKILFLVFKRVYFFMALKMVHILDLVLESDTISFFSQCLQNACRMRQQLCQIDHPDPITKMPFTRSLVSVLPRVIRLTFCLHRFQVLADALRVNATIEELALYGNQFGDEGVKAWWLQRGEFGGPSKIIQIQWIYFSGSTICSRDEFGTPQ